MATPSSSPRPLTGDNLIDAATHGFVWQVSTSRTIDWALADGFVDEFWNYPAATANALATAFGTFSYYANINFNYKGYFDTPIAAANAGSDITVSLDGYGLLVGGFSTWAIGLPPYASLNNVFYQGAPGDIYLNINSQANFLPSYAPGSAGFALMLHEIGHTLGLKHPFDDGGTGPIRKSIRPRLRRAECVRREPVRARSPSAHNRSYVHARFLPPLRKPRSKLTAAVNCWAIYSQHQSKASAFPPPGSFEA